ncbi:MAG: hypothetical protein IKB01_09315 [Lachnospiraceae bacterium]|nr:hypothetical protein [Lachnospiraceae bacterium]MBR3684079.1 hypothetical protein [Lachnospiraceae bacterium]
MLFKDKKRRILAGIDLSDKNTQISIFNTDQAAPVTISTVTGKEQFNIPTVLCKRFGVNQWFYGKEAIKHVEDGDGILVENLVSKALRKEEVLIDKDRYNPIDLLGLFVKRVLALATSAGEVDKVDGLMITVEYLNKDVISVLQKIIPTLGLPENTVFVQSHMESFFQFMIHQPEELWIQQVVVFDYSAEVLKSYRLETNRRTTPVVAFIEEKEFLSMPFEKVPEEESIRGEICSRMDGRFLDVVKEVCEDKIISTCYLLGEGFLGDWCKDSLKLLCRNRRVFQGNNLYSKGACYGLYERLQPTEKSKRYIYLGQDKIKANVGMAVYEQGKDVYFPVMDAGMNWYDAKKEWDMIMDTKEDRNLSFLLTPLNGRDRKEKVISLANMPERPDGTTRIRVNVEFTSEAKFTVTVRDMGFGEFFPSSGLEWKEEITWQE